MVAPALAPSVECVELLDLTPTPAAMTKAWRQQTAAEIVAAPSPPRLDAFAACLLDASPDAQAERLTPRGEDPALLPHHQAFAGWMREQAWGPSTRPR